MSSNGSEHHFSRRTAQGSAKLAPRRSKARTGGSADITRKAIKLLAKGRLRVKYSEHKRIKKTALLIYEATRRGSVAYIENTSVLSGYADPNGELDDIHIEVANVPMDAPYRAGHRMAFMIVRRGADLTDENNSIPASTSENSEHTAKQGIGRPSSSATTNRRHENAPTTEHLASFGAETRKDVSSIASKLEMNLRRLVTLRPWLLQVDHFGIPIRCPLYYVLSGLTSSEATATSMR